MKSAHHTLYLCENTFTMAKGHFIYIYNIYKIHIYVILCMYITKLLRYEMRINTVLKITLE